MMSEAKTPQDLLPYYNSNSTIKDNDSQSNITTEEYYSYVLLFFFLLALLCVNLFLWPYSPTVHATHHLTRLSVSPPSPASFDLTLTLHFNAHKLAIYRLDYQSLVSSMSYRGSRLGSVNVNVTGGSIKGGRKSDFEAVMQLHGVRIVDESVYLHLIEDLTKGSVPLETFTEVQGILDMSWFGRFPEPCPVKGNISCSLNVNPKSQKIVSQVCYSKILLN